MYRNFKEYVLDVIKFKYDELFTSGSDLYNISESGVPAIPPQMNKYRDLMKYIKDFSKYYKSRLSFYEYLYNSVTNKVNEIKTILNQTKILSTNAYSSANADVNGDSAKLSDIVLETIQLTNPIFLPKPDIIKNNTIFYRTKPKTFDFTAGPCALFKYENTKLPDNIPGVDGFIIVDENLEECSIDSRKYIAVNISSYKQVDLNSQLYYAFQVPDLIEFNIIHDNKEGYFIKEIDMDKNIKIDINSVGYLTAELIVDEDFTMTIPTSGYICEKAVSYQVMDSGEYVVYLSYPIVNIISSSTDGRITQLDNSNAIYTNCDPLVTYFKYIPSIDNLDYDIGEYTEGLNWSSDDSKDNYRFLFSGFIKNTICIENVDIGRDEEYYDYELTKDIARSSPGTLNIEIPVDDENMIAIPTSVYFYPSGESFPGVGTAFKLYEYKEDTSFNSTITFDNLLYYVNRIQAFNYLDIVNLQNIDTNYFTWAYTDQSIITTPIQNAASLGYMKDIEDPTTDWSFNIRIYYLLVPKKVNLKISLHKVGNIEPSCYVGKTRQIRCGKPKNVKEGIMFNRFTRQDPTTQSASIGSSPDSYSGGGVS